MRAGHARPPVEDLQLSDSLRHGFATILCFICILNFLEFCKATSLSGIAVGEAEREKEEIGRSCGRQFLSAPAKEKSVSSWLVGLLTARTSMQDCVIIFRMPDSSCLGYRIDTQW